MWGVAHLVCYNKTTWKEGMIDFGGTLETTRLISIYIYIFQINETGMMVTACRAFQVKACGKSYITWRLLSTGNLYCCKHALIIGRKNWYAQLALRQCADLRRSTASWVYTTKTCDNPRLSLAVTYWYAAHHALFFFRFWNHKWYLYFPFEPERKRRWRRLTAFNEALCCLLRRNPEWFILVDPFSFQ